MYENGQIAAKFTIPRVCICLKHACFYELMYCCFQFIENWVNLSGMRHVTHLVADWVERINETL